MCNATDRRTDVGDSFFSPLRSKDPTFTKMSHLSESTDALWRCYIHQELTCKYKTALGIETTKCLYRSTWDFVYVYTWTNIAVAPPSKVGVMSKAKFAFEVLLSPTKYHFSHDLSYCFFKWDGNKTMDFLQENPTGLPTESLPEISVSTEVLQSELQRLRVPLKFHGRNVGTNWVQDGPR